MIAGRPTRRTAGSSATPARAAHGNAARGGGLQVQRHGSAPAVRARVGARDRGGRSGTCHALGITGWQRVGHAGTLEAYRSLADDGRLTAGSWGRCGGTGTGGWSRSTTWSSSGRAGVRSASCRPRSRSWWTACSRTTPGRCSEPYCDGCGGPAQAYNRGLHVRRPPGCSTRLSPSWTGSDSRCTCTRSGTAPSATPSTRWRPRGPPTGRAGQPAPHHIAAGRCTPTDLPRFRRLAVTANCQAYWAQSEPQMDELTLPYLGPERGGAAVPLRASCTRLGTTLAMGSDWGVTTANPLEQIEVAVRRVDPEDRGNAPFLPAPGDCPSPVAVAAFTAGSAHVNHDDEAPGAPLSSAGAPTWPCSTATSSTPAPACPPTPP